MKAFSFHSTAPYCLIIAFATSLVSPAFSADAGKDPLQPPPAWLTAQTAAASGDKKASTTSAMAASRVSVLVLGKKRKVAVIDGALVVRGDSVNDTKIAALHADRIEMEDDKKSITVRPGVEKKRPSIASFTKREKKSPIVIPVANLPSPPNKGK